MKNFKVSLPFFFQFSLGSNIPKNTWRPISEEAIKEGLQICLERSNLPCLVMCATGYQDTGTFVGCFRKLQGWNFNGIFFEYQSFAGTKSRYVNEQFIELFDLDLITVPKDPPFLLISQPNRIESVKTNNDIPLDT
ncbi:tyrosine-protein phosphatase required for protection against superoxide stress (By similarity) [Lobulomyces angularis]|nr:tyrosine-protein phosphatase required for protection against superoxide stress (By similarity) [Lobulomyces angularis]